MEFPELAKEEFDQYRVDLNRYEKEGIIGKGIFARVLKCRDKVENKQVALKLLSVLPEEEEREQYIKNFSREISVLAKVKGRFLLHLFGFSTNPKPLLITQLVPNGNLLDKLKSKGPNLTSTQKTIIAIGIAHGMKYLHSLNILHRDLKPDHVLLDENFHPVICGFGISRFYDPTKALEMTQAIGSINYMSPFLFNCQKYGSEVDVWSYGATLFHMLVGNSPYSEVKSQVEIFQKLKSLVPPSIPNNYKDHGISALIMKCFATDTSKLINFSQIIDIFNQDKNVWFQGSDETTVFDFIQSIQENLT